MGESASDDGSTRRLVRLCASYFVFYAITGVSVKYFLGSTAKGFPGLQGIEFLVYSTVGGNGICLFVVIARKWFRLKSNGYIHVGPLSFPREFLYIVPSGICTAVVVPTTTLMYTLPMSVMVAMVMMRGSVIVISRCVDAIQIRQGILKKRLYREEDLAVLFALGAVGVDLASASGGGFDFARSPAALTILASYIGSYAIRIYLMNYYKNTRAPGVKLDNEGFFAVEQLTASVTMLAMGAVLVFSSWSHPQVVLFRDAVLHPKPVWPGAVVAGLAYGMVAFFSVFIFMFKGRTATFAGLINRLTSLVAGTVATLIFCFFFGGEFPKLHDWLSLGFILVAVAFLSQAERKRAAEPKEAPPATAVPTTAATS